MLNWSGKFALFQEHGKSMRLCKRDPHVADFFAPARRSYRYVKCCRSALQARLSLPHEIRRYDKPPQMFLIVQERLAGAIIPAA